MAGDLLSCTQRLLGSRIGEASHLGPVRQNNAARTIDKTFSPTRLNTPDHLHTPSRPLPESFPVPRPFSRPFPRPSKARLPFDLSMLWRQATWQHKNGVKTVCGCAGKKRCKEVQNPTSDVPCRQRNRVALQALHCVLPPVRVHALEKAGRKHTHRENREPRRLSQRFVARHRARLCRRGDQVAARRSTFRTSVDVSRYRPPEWFQVESLQVQRRLPSSPARGLGLA